MKKIIIDTNSYARLLAGDDNVLGAISSAETIYMSVFVLGELYAGFAGGAKKRENMDTLQRFLMKPAVKILNATAETAEVFGQVKFNLKRSGTPLPINDVWIAACCMEVGGTLLTRDRHFEVVEQIESIIVKA